MIKKILVFWLLFIPLNLYAQVPTDDILAVLQAQEQAWNRGDMKGYMQGYWHSDTLRFVSEGDFKFGWQNMYDMYKKSEENQLSLGKLRFTVDEVNMLNNETAIVTGFWFISRLKDKLQGVFTLVMEKKQGVWVITQEHSSSGKS